MGARVVCISRSFGARGEEVGRLVAERLGFRYVDEEIVALAAERGGIDTRALADEEQRKGLALRVIESIAAAGAPEGFFPYEAGAERLDSNVHRALIRDVIEEVGGRGDAVIVAHAASMALAGRDGVLRVLVTASPEMRARRVGEDRELDRKAAAKLVRDEDAARASYFKRFYEVDRELPTHYDLVVSTASLTPEQAADVVVHAAQLDR